MFQVTGSLFNFFFITCCFYLLVPILLVFFSNRVCYRNLSLDLVNSLLDRFFSFSFLFLYLPFYLILVLKRSFSTAEIFFVLCYIVLSMFFVAFLYLSLLVFLNSCPSCFFSDLSSMRLFKVEHDDSASPRVS